MAVGVDVGEGVSIGVTTAVAVGVGEAVAVGVGVPPAYVIASTGGLVLSRVSNRLADIGKNSSDALTIQPKLVSG